MREPRGGSAPRSPRRVGLLPFPDPSPEKELPKKPQEPQITQNKEI
jgi:hypothetical protein